VKISGGSNHRGEDERTGRPEDDLLVQADGVSESPSDVTEPEGQPESPLGVSGDVLDTGALGNTQAGTPDEAGVVPDAESAGAAAGTEGDEDAAGAEDPDEGTVGEGAEDPDEGTVGEGAEDSGEAAVGEGAEDPDEGTVGEGAEDPDEGTVGEGAEDPDEAAVGEGEGDEPAAGGKMEKVRRLAALRIDSKRVRASWLGNTLAKTALIAVCVYALVAGSAYFLVMQPMSMRLHRVREQKGLLHDYMSIQQAGAAIHTFRDGLMTGDQRLTVMSEVKLMAEQSGVTIVGDAELLLARDVSGFFVEYPLRLRIRGTFHEMGEFLSLLEGSPRFTLVEEIEIMSDADSRERDSEATMLLALAAWEG
jgi:Tfp pilus assembly protein PilO